MVRFKGTKLNAVMVYLPIYPPPNRTHSLIRSCMPHIRLYSVSALMLSHARWRFLISACSVITGSIMSSSLCTIAASSRWETGQSCCPVTHPCPKTLEGCPSTTVECWRRDELKHRLAGRSPRDIFGSSSTCVGAPVCLFRLSRTLQTSSELLHVVLGRHGLTAGEDVEL